MNRKTVYIVLFRGVGGKTQLPVGLLKDALLAAGFDNVATYINSGNAVLQSALPHDELIECIADLSAREFGFKKEIFALTKNEWGSLIANNPFPEAVMTPTFLHTAVLADRPENENIEILKSYALDGENISIINNIAYLHTPHGFGSSRFATKFDKLIAVSNTARNWNTVLKLMQIASSIPAE